ncbi:hypothetical protein AT6N2_C3461 [Agrobacterium tumefaciens]|nr:hypothetical protein AT6N2_C3461 [Agrobacterium tumefaciens]CUX10203.1 hypothetical protein AGR8A_Cc30201 [Agrobacterium fabrum str. J-07]
MNKDISATIVWLDEAEAFVGIEEFYGASFGHASGPFRSARVQLQAALQFCPAWALAGSS